MRCAKWSRAAGSQNVGMGQGRASGAGEASEEDTFVCPTCLTRPTLPRLEAVPYAETEHARRDDVRRLEIRRAVAVRLTGDRVDVQNCLFQQVQQTPAIDCPFRQGNDTLGNTVWSSLHPLVAAGLVLGANRDGRIEGIANLHFAHEVIAALRGE